MGFGLAHRCLGKQLGPWLPLYILEFVIEAAPAAVGLVLVCGLCICPAMSRTAPGEMASALYIRICYCGNSCVDGSGAGVWGLTLYCDVSISDWAHGLRL